MWNWTLWNSQKKTGRSLFDMNCSNIFFSPSPRIMEIKTKTNGTYLNSKAFAQQRKESVQSLSHLRLFATPWTAACQASLSITNSWSLLKLMSIESVMPSNYLILCCPLLLLPSTFPSIKVFSNESILCIRWPKYWSFSFNISPSNEYSELISFRIYWFNLFAVQGTLKSLLQHHISKASNAYLGHIPLFIIYWATTLCSAV